ncbi:MAG: hypothetical protein KBH21_00250 [Acetoanaerobium sp.]|nr:hypothetical protein [Acetoanaerobium sp.]
MSNSLFTTIKNFKSDIKTLSKVVNKFDFHDLEALILEEEVKTKNHSIFETYLCTGKAYAFLNHAMKHVYCYGGLYTAENMSEIKLVNLIYFLYKLPETNFTGKIRGNYNTGTKKVDWVEAKQLGLNEIIASFEAQKAAQIAAAKKAAQIAAV